jgi:hypothetical protein
MEYVWAVAVTKHAVLVDVVVRVATDVRAAVDDAHAQTAVLGQQACRHGAREARADDEYVIRGGARTLSGGDRCHSHVVGRCTGDLSPGARATCV